MNVLAKQLGAVRRRLYAVVTLRGIAWMLALVLLAAVAAGILDWRVHLPGVIRALILVAILSWTGLVAYRRLVRPLMTKTDDVSLALQLESLHPDLNDALASAVQFLKMAPSADEHSSASMRQEAIRRALEKARRLSFHEIIDGRGLRPAVTLGVLAIAAVVILGSVFPTESRIGFLRLAVPFGAQEWPRQTQMQLAFNTPAARGEPFEIKGVLGGVIPDRIVLEIRGDGQPVQRETYQITQAAEASECQFVARLEGPRVQRPFRFQLRANDALSPWHDVEVLPAPQLVALEGRPSPQIQLNYPSYTGLGTVHLPDGVSGFETLSGTGVMLRAAADRPLRAAWLEFPPEQQGTLAVAAALSGWPMPSAGIQQIPASLSHDGRVLSINWLARLTGTFVLHLQDSAGLSGSRLIEIRTNADPAPTVTLVRPARSHDSFDILPDATITLQVTAEDPVLALRDVYVEYRRRTSDGGTSWPERLSLYDHETVGRLVPGLMYLGYPHILNLHALAVQAAPPRLELSRRWSLRNLGLQDGDVLLVRACARDFDDVTANKRPGISHEIELRIVSRTVLDINLNQAQVEVQQELLRLQKLQEEAIQKTAPAETQWRNTGKLQPGQLDQLLQSEQVQQQIRSRVGNEQEGLRSDVARLMRAFQDNGLPRSGNQERMEAVQTELDRLARGQLDQVEPLLTEARKESETAQTPKSPPERAQGPLTAARKHQDEIKKTIDALLNMLEPWSTTQEVKGEARSILQEQRNQQKLTEAMGKEDQAGKRPDELRPEQRAEIEKAEEAQKRLAERADQLMAKMDRMAESNRSTDPDTAQQLKEAAAKGRNERNNAAGKMQEAAQNIRENRLAEATANQRDAANTMEEVVRTLEDRREEELDRLLKKVKEAENKLDRLQAEQERLVKSLKDAARLTDPKAKEAELKRLAREQQKLQQQVQEMVRELTRLRSNRASQAMEQSAGQMQRASRQIQQGAEAEEEQREALDRLNEAREELEEFRDQIEEELARERLARLGDEIKRLQERQEGLLAESGRIHREVLQQRGWPRTLRRSLLNLSENQKGLSEETQALVKSKLDNLKLFAHLMSKAAEAMLEASRLMTAPRPADGPVDTSSSQAEQSGFNLAAENDFTTSIQEAQKTALRRIAMLLEALKADTGGFTRTPRKQSSQPEQQQPGQQGGGNQGNQKQNENQPPATEELKILRGLQQEVNDKTKEFNKKHPDRTKLTGGQQAELGRLTQEQQEITGLYLELIGPAEGRDEPKSSQTGSKPERKNP